MADRKSLDFEDYRQYAGSQNATKQSQMQDFMSNQNKILTQVAGQIAWLPATSYSVGNVIYCGQGLWAKCTIGGTSGNTEPTWGIGLINDGAVRWNVTETISALADAVNAIAAHIAANNNPHGVTKLDVGLGSVANTGDTAIPAQNSTAKFTAGGAYAELIKKLDKSGGTMTGALNFANGIWNLCGDDAYFGDNNITGCFCVKGNNGTTGIGFTRYGTNVTDKLTDDNGTLKWNGQIVRVGDDSLTVTASTQANITCGYSYWTNGGGVSMSGTTLNAVTGVGAGTYTLQQIIQQLVNKSHTHTTTSNCNCNCDCTCSGG